MYKENFQEGTRRKPTNIPKLSSWDKKKHASSQTQLHLVCPTLFLRYCFIFLGWNYLSLFIFHCSSCSSHNHKLLRYKIFRSGYSKHNFLTVPPFFVYWCYVIIFKERIFLSSCVPEGILTRWSIFFTSPVSGQNVMIDRREVKKGHESRSFD